MKTWFGRIALVLALLAAFPPALSAQAPIAPGGSCIAIDHAPSQPIGNAPSLSRFFVAVSPDYAGDSLTVMIDGSSGPQQGSGPIDSNGLGVTEVPLFSFGPHQVVNLFVTNNATTPVDVGSLVNGGMFTVDTSEPSCDPSTVGLVSATTTTTAPPTTTTAAATTSTSSATTTTALTTTTAATTTTASTSAGNEIANWLPWLLIALGGLAAVVGLFLLAKKNCDELYRLWQASRGRYETCQEELTKAQAWLDAKRAERRRVQQELGRLELSSRMGSSTDQGTTFQSVPGAGLVTEEGMTAIIQATQAQVESAQESEQMGEEMVTNWRRRTEEAAAEAEAARREYQDCVGESVPIAPTMISTATAATTTRGGPGVATTTSSNGGCPQGDRRVVPLADVKSFRVIRAFRIETDTQGEGVAGDAGLQLAADLNQLGAELGFLGSLLGAHGAGTRIGESLVRNGSAANLVRGGAEGYAAAEGNLGTDIFPVPIPTSPQEVVVGVLQLIAQLAGTVATKANEWMDRRSFVSYRLVRVYQMITVRPYKVEECDGQTYRCVERILEYQIGDSGEETGNWRDGGTGIGQMNKDRQQRELQTLINQGKSAMERSARAILELETQYPPGPC